MQDRRLHPDKRHVSLESLKTICSGLFPKKGGLLAPLVPYVLELVSHFRDFASRGILVGIVSYLFVICQVCCSL
jgi:hypothetical protein